MSKEKSHDLKDIRPLREINMDKPRFRERAGVAIKAFSTKQIRDIAQGFYGWGTVFCTNELLRNKPNTPKHEIRRRVVAGSPKQLAKALTIAAVLTYGGYKGVEHIQDTISNSSGPALINKIYTNKTPRGIPLHDAIIPARINMVESAISEYVAPAYFSKMRKVGLYPHHSRNASDLSSLQRSTTALIKLSEAIEELGKIATNGQLSLNGLDDAQRKTVGEVYDNLSTLQQEGAISNMTDDPSQYSLQEIYNAYKGLPDALKLADHNLYTGNTQRNSATATEKTAIGFEGIGAG